MHAIIETIRERSQAPDNLSHHERIEWSHLWQDETTWVAEALSAPLEKDRIYDYRNGELFSPEGQGLTQIFEDSVDYYREQAYRDPSIAFQYRRSIVEMAELDRMLRMARGEGGNVLVVVSTFPDELRDATEDKLGYQVKRKLGFIRVISRLPDNQLKMWTHSFDGNDPDGISTMFADLGETVDWSRDVLEQVVELDMPQEASEFLGDRLLYDYDKTLHEKHGGNYFAGRSEADRREAIKFVESQSDLVEHHVRQVLKHGKDPGYKSNQRYEFAIAMRRRHEGKQVVASDLAGEMSAAGDAGRAAGETASGCGVTATGTTNSSVDGLNESGYRVVDYKSKMHEGQAKKDDCMQCPYCRKRGVLIEKLGGNIHYTCESSGGCGKTTKSSEMVTRQGAEDVAERPAETETSLGEVDSEEASFDAIIRREFGEYAVRRLVFVPGGTREIAVDSRTGSELVV